MVKCVVKNLRVFVLRHIVRVRHCDGLALIRKVSFCYMFHAVMFKISSSLLKSCPNAEFIAQRDGGSVECQASNKNLFFPAQSRAPHQWRVQSFELPGQTGNSKNE